MAFHVVSSPKAYARAVPGERTVRMAAVTRGRQKMIAFTLSRDLASDLGWHRRDRLLVLLGAGRDSGMIVLTRTLSPKAGNVLGASNSPAWLKMIVTIPRVVGSLTREQIVAGLPEGTTILEHEIRDGNLEIIVPKLRLRVAAAAERIAA